MKVLTAAEMRDVDRRTMELGIPDVVLMENAGHRVVELLEREFAPLAAQRVVVFCGKGNNGGDGLVAARQLLTRFHPRSLHVVLAGDPPANLRMFEACGGRVDREVTVEMRAATLVIDALLGTGIKGPASGRMLELIREINTGFPQARIVTVDVPSGMASDSGSSEGEFARADLCVTFTAPKPCHVLPPNCDHVGRLTIGLIGSPESLMDAAPLSLSEPSDFRRLLAPRPSDGHKGTFGHALIIAGSRGKTGAAAMAGIAALRAGAGLVTVASAESAIGVIASHAPEIMTEPLPETDAGSISPHAFDDGRMDGLLKGKTVIAIGPGLGTHAETGAFVGKLARRWEGPLVVDADALPHVGARTASPTILTPHPGEMRRLLGVEVADRLAAARDYSAAHGCVTVLKGQRTVIAFPGGAVWINPTGTPAMGTGGTGDILTGMIAGLVAQFPNDHSAAVRAAVYLHGLAGELGAASLGEQSLIATDLLRFLPEAMRACRAS